MARPNQRKQVEAEPCIHCGTPTHRKIYLVKSSNERTIMNIGEHKAVCQMCQGNHTRYEDI